MGLSIEQGLQQQRSEGCMGPFRVKLALTPSPEALS